MNKRSLSNGRASGWDAYWKQGESMKLAIWICGLVFISIGGVAVAGDSYDHCTGFIDSVPATISTQGTWCLKKDLSTAVTSGSAINIAVNNVTIDCKGFKLGGLAAGAATTAFGISSSGRLNSSVRHCNIRGFFSGISFSGSGGGHLVEANRFDSNTRQGIRIDGDGSMVRNNLIVATGGSVDPEFRGIAEGIYVGEGDVDIIDNTIAGVSPEVGNFGSSSAVGIEYDSGGGVISRNRIRGLAPDPGGDQSAVAINVSVHVNENSRALISENHLVGEGVPGYAYGVTCTSPFVVLRDNTVAGFSFLETNCTDGGGNFLGN